jgi:putative tryptophan/tyrosine transport system substrate-binding protein
MRRRTFIAGLGSAAAWPVVAHAQQPAMPVVGFLHSARPNTAANRVRAFRQGLTEAGFVEGRNVAIEFRFAELQNDRLPALAADLVRRQVAVIAGLNSTEGVRVAKAATTTIPIVFVIGGDPVKNGLVASLNRPGGNVTGVTSLGNELGPKRLGLLRYLLPNAGLIAALVNPTNPNAESDAKDLLAAARTLGVELDVLRASTEREIDGVFTSLVQSRAGGLVIGADPFFAGREQLVALMVRYAMPTIYTPEFAAAGGLLGYGASPTDDYRLAGVYTGRVLAGAKPADLPVVQSTKLELIINLKTAKALGLTIPETLLATADEVIQ